MKYHHGTDKNFDKFNIDIAQEYKDFGKGIYLAEGEWHAQKIAKRKNGRHAFVRIYDFDIKDMKKNFKVKIFKKDNNDWLKFVLLNRNKIISPEYDVVFGSTADADAQNKLESFYRKHKHKKPSHKDYDALRKDLQTNNFPKQICITSQVALDYLEEHFIGIYDMNESASSYEE